MILTAQFELLVIELFKVIIGEKNANLPYILSAKGICWSLNLFSKLQVLVMHTLSLQVKTRKKYEDVE